MRFCFTAAVASTASSLSLTSYSVRWARPDCSDGPCASTPSVTKRFSVFSTSGENSARVYKYKIQAEYEDLSQDKLALMKEHYEAEGVERNNVAYGFVGKKSA